MRLRFPLCLALAACGTTQVSQGIDAGLPPPIVPPNVACAATPRGCTCSPTDADAVPATCDRSIVPDASCCQGPDYPFVGDCACGALLCGDGGAPAESCSTPTPITDAGTCDPAHCNGSACGGGMCCVSSCQGGVCQPTCS